MSELKQLTIEVRLTEQCQLRCKHCLAHLSNQYMSFNTLIKTFETIRRFIDKHSDKYFVEISFSGGEPLLYKNFEFATNLMSNTDALFLMHTNGILLSKNLHLLEDLTGTVLISNDRFHKSELSKFKKHKIFDKDFKLGNLSIEFNEPIVDWLVINNKNENYSASSEVKKSSKINVDDFKFLGININGDYYSEPNFDYTPIGNIEKIEINESLFSK